MNLFCKSLFYSTAVVVLLALVFEPSQIKCYSLKKGSYDSYNITKSPPKTICTGNRAYFSQTRKCYKDGSKGPCAERMVVSKLTPETEFGQCVCESPCYGRPMVNIPGQNRCYFIFEQGPCPSGHWLVPLAEHVTVCEPIPCPESYDALPKPFDFNRQFLFSYNGQCYMTGVKGAGPCPADEAAYIFGVSHFCSSSGFGCGAAGTGAGFNDCEDRRVPDAFGGANPPRSCRNNNRMLR